MAQEIDSFLIAWNYSDNEDGNEDSSSSICPVSAELLFSISLVVAFIVIMVRGPVNLSVCLT